MEKLIHPAYDKKALSLIIVGFLSFIWGTTYIATKIAIQTVPVFMMTGIRELIAGMVLLIIAFALEKPGRYSWIAIIRQGVFGLGFFTGARGMMTLSLDFIPAGLVALVNSLVPVYVLFLNAFTGHFFINRQIIWGMFLGALGMILVFHESLKDILSTGHLIGIGVAFLGALSWAGTSVLVSGKKDTMPPLFRSAVQLMFGSAGLWLISLINGETIDPSSVGINAVLAILYLALFGSVAGFVSYVFAIKYLPVARVTLYAYINPFVALFFGWLILGELLNLELLLCFSITLAGVYLVNRGYRKARE